jgi:hypothetical protein
MILYHFSTLTRFLVPSEMECEPPQEGLTPHAVRFEHATCVWLTSDPVPGIVDPKRTCLRFTVRILDGDRRLVAYKKWMRRRKLDPATLIADEPLAARAMRAWWLYFGTIPCTNIVGFELLRGRREWWLERTP